MVHRDMATETLAFVVTLLVAFFASCVVALPIYALGLAAPLIIVLPLSFGVGALVATLVTWLTAVAFRAHDQRASFWSLLLRSETTAVVLLFVVIFLPLPRSLTIVGSMAIVTYRVTAKATLTSDEHLVE